MDIRFTTSGYYSISRSKSHEVLSKFSEENYDTNLLSIGKVALKTSNEKLKIAEKLHKQLKRFSTSKILKFVETFEIEDSEL